MKIVKNNCFVVETCLNQMSKNQLIRSNTTGRSCRKRKFVFSTEN